MGGPLLWPTGEPWPYCAQSGHWAFGTCGDSAGESKPGAVPMVPVIQLFARDVPWWEFPEGKDVVQLLWCALIHEEDPAGVVLPKLYWRNEAETVARRLLHHFPTPREYEDDFVPRPCTVCPTPAVEYPGHDLPNELLTALRPRLEELQDRFGFWCTEAASALQNKVGGYPAWTQSPDWPHCGEGHRMEHLFSVTGEPAYGIGSPWTSTNPERRNRSGTLQRQRTSLTPLGRNLRSGTQEASTSSCAAGAPICRTHTATTATERRVDTLRIRRANVWASPAPH